MQIQFLNGPRAGQNISIDQPSTTFGRTAASEVVLEWDPLVSSRHFEIARMEHGTFFRDLGSRNGSKINGSAVEQQFLQEGDLIEVGHSKLKIVLTATQSPSAPYETVPSEQLRDASPADSRSTPPAHQNSSGSPTPASPVPLNPISVNADSVSADSVNSNSVKSSSTDRISGSPESNRRKPLNPLESSIFIPVSKDIQQPDSQSSDSQSSDSHHSDSYQPDTHQSQSHQSESFENAIVQVRLQVLSESESAGDGSVAKLFWIGPGQSLTFGRSARCDCWWDRDPFLSSVHFKLQCHSDSCYLEDLQSSSGTWLNETRITQAQLFDGDSILAGKTQLRVEVEGTMGPIARESSGLSPLDPEDSALVPPAAPPPSQSSSKPQTNTGKPELAVVSCPSGLTTLTGLDAKQVPPDVIIESLVTEGQAYLLVDLSRCECELPEGFDWKSSQLLRWLPDEVAARSPHLLALSELTQWKNLAGAVSGKDALVVLLSQSDRASLLGHLQKLLRADPGEQSGNPSRGMLGFCWPSVMQACLENGADGFSDALFQQVNLVMVETDDGAAHSIFAADPAWIERIKQLLNLDE